MTREIIYVCKSINNKNVREGELKILEKHESELYFEFGEDSTNTKKRYYDDVKVLNEDFEALQKLKKAEEKDSKKYMSKEEDVDSEETEKVKKTSYNKKEMF